MNVALCDKLTSKDAQEACKIEVEVKTKANVVIGYNMVLDFKDGKYRFKISDYNFVNPSKHAMEVWLDKKSNYYNPQCDSYLVQVDEYTKDLIKKLKLGMKAPVVKKDDW